MLKRGILILPLLLLLSGCFFEKYHETMNYDLAQPVSYCPVNIVVIVKDFDSISGSGLKMRYRGEQQQILIDSYNSWIASPEILLTKYFSIAFSQSDRDLLAEPCLVLSGTLNSFDIDLVKQNISIVITYQLSERKSGKILALKEISAVAPFKQNYPPEFATSASVAAKILTDKIRAEIMNIARSDNK
jgi:ABC-type uncharacterized transport system auxiliary subunit